MVENNYNGLNQKNYRYIKKSPKKNNNLLLIFSILVIVGIVAVIIFMWKPWENNTEDNTSGVSTSQPSTSQPSTSQSSTSQNSNAKSVCDVNVWYPRANESNIDLGDTRSTSTLRNCEKCKCICPPNYIYGYHTDNNYQYKCIPPPCTGTRGGRERDPTVNEALPGSSWDDGRFAIRCNDITDENDGGEYCLGGDGDSATGANCNDCFAGPIKNGKYYQCKKNPNRGNSKTYCIPDTICSYNNPANINPNTYTS